MSRPLRVLVVDDEPLARAGVAALLEGDPEVEVVGECGDGEAAVRAIRSLAPDLVLLDVQMPEMDGVEVVRAVGAERMPPVVFVTAYDRFAVEAFDLSAVDYLVKPFTDERFHRAIARAKEASRQQEVRALGHRLLDLLGRTPSPAAPPAAAESAPATHLPVKAPGRTLFVPVREIVWVEAEGAYARVHLEGKAHLVRETLGAIGDRLDPAHFVRTHRSAVVNVGWIRELQSFSRGEYLLILRNGAKVPLSRRRKGAVERLLGRPL